MNQQEPTLTMTISGDLADWLEQEADRNTRTPSQQLEFILKGIKHRAQLRKQASEERKAKREALFGASARRQRAA